MDESVFTRMRVRPGVRCGSVYAPSAFIAMARAQRRCVFTAQGPWDVAVVFIERLDQAAQRLAVAQGQLTAEGALWAAYPRGEQTLNRDSLRQAAEPLGLTACASVRLDDTWSLLRLKPRAQAPRPRRGPLERVAQEIRARYPRAQLTRSGELTLIRLGERYIALEQTGDGLTLHFSCLGAPKLLQQRPGVRVQVGRATIAPRSALPMGAIRQAVDHCFSPLQSRP